MYCFFGFRVWLSSLLTFFLVWSLGSVSRKGVPDRVDPVILVGGADAIFPNYLRIQDFHLGRSPFILFSWIVTTVLFFVYRGLVAKPAFHLPYRLGLSIALFLFRDAIP